MLRLPTPVPSVRRSLRIRTRNSKLEEPNTTPSQPKSKPLSAKTTRAAKTAPIDKKKSASTNRRRTTAAKKKETAPELPSIAAAPFEPPLLDRHRNDKPFARTEPEDTLDYEIISNPRRTPWYHDYVSEPDKQDAAIQDTIIGRNRLPAASSLNTIVAVDIYRGTPNDLDYSVKSPLNCLDPIRSLIEASSLNRKHDSYCHLANLRASNTPVLALPTPPYVPALDLPYADTMIVERRVKLVTEQHNIPKPSPMEGFPMKEWTVEVYILDEAGRERPAKCFQKVVYNLHPSFDNAVQTFHEPPFKCTNEGWGEFEMTIDCYTTEKGGKQSMIHDLNFAKPTYENIHTVHFKNPSQALQAVLRETGPLPTDEDRKARKNADGAAAAAKKKKLYDLEKMADAIPRLNEDDLLHVIQLIHDNKSDDTYIMNNPDAGEFSIDLYTMPDNLCRLMWEFLLTSSESHRLR